MDTFSELVRTVRADVQATGPASDTLTVIVFRVGQYTSARRWRFPLHVIYRIIDMLWVRMIVGAELPPSVKAGPGLRLRHWGRGVVLHPDVILGSQVCLYHRVTIGTNGKGVPVLGDGVYVGVGATIIGPVTVGDRAKIGAGAVVTGDVAPATTAIGFHKRSA